MARPKIPRKSTNIDMTAMCDVAFLLLSFFILTTKFKKAEPVTIQTPNSVSSKASPEENIVVVTIAKDGKVFLSMDKEDKKKNVLEALNAQRGLGLSDGEIDKLSKQPIFGADVNQLKQIAALPIEKINGDNLPGLTVKDSTQNQMVEWLGAVTTVYPRRSDMTLLLNGDQESKYPALKNVMYAFKKNNLMNFKLVTNPESIPAGTALYADTYTKKN